MGEDTTSTEVYLKEKAEKTFRRDVNVVSSSINDDDLLFPASSYFSKSKPLEPITINYIPKKSWSHGAKVIFDNKNERTQKKTYSKGRRYQEFSFPI